MTLQDVFFVGKTVYVTTVHTKAAGQAGTPSTVNATVAVQRKDPLTVAVSPAPTATVTMNGGVATVTWSVPVGATTALAAGRWEFRVVTTGDIIDAYDGCFYIRESELV